MSTVDQAVEILNRIHAADSTVLPALIEHRVACNEQLATDPTVQVRGRVGEAEVGLLGIINGLFGVDDNSRGFIGAEYDTDHRLTGFVRLDRQ